MANTLELGNGKWATGKDTVLAFNDENNNFKPLPFSFSRASSGTVVNKEGLIETVGSGEPRIDFKDNTKGALLLEPSRTNYITQSNDFSGWNAGYLYVTSNYAISPDGTQNASRCLFTGTNQLIITPTSATGTLTGSMYVKGVSGETIQLSAGGGEDLITLTGEWQRLIVTKTNINGTFNLNTFGGATARDLLIYGAQLEQGSYATSYIPTSGSAVTRVAESTSQTVPDGVKIENQGSLYFEFNSSYLETYSQRILTISEDANNLIEFQLAGSNLLTFVLVKSGQSGVVITKPFPAITLGENTKIAAAFSNGDFVFYVNGILIGTDTDVSKSVPTISDIKFSRYNSTTPFVGSVNNLKLYNTRLSNSELQALTQ